MNFPLYRKYAHGQTYFKISSETEWEELHLLGDKCTVHYFTAKILPDRNYVADLIANTKKNWEEVAEEEYMNKKKECG